MSKPLKIRWLIVLGIWGAALAVTYWNWHKINTAMLSQVRMEQLRREFMFQSQKANALNEVLRIYEKLYYPVPSAKLGMIFVEDQIRGLAKPHDLKVMDLRSQVDAAMSDQVVGTLLVEGDLPQIVKFLSGMTQYPYLPVKHCQLKILPVDSRCQAEIEFGFLYREITLSDGQDLHWQTSDAAKENKGNPL